MQMGGVNSAAEKDKWNDTIFDLTHFMALLKLKLGINSLFRFYVEADARHSDRNVIYVSGRQVHRSLVPAMRSVT